MITPPEISETEIKRLLSLSAFDFNYPDLNESLSHFTQLAAGIAGTSISLINLVDAYTQWSIARHGFELEQMPREDSVCQYTILEDEQLEVKNLSLDARFKDKDYVAGAQQLRYYFGVPLKTADGYHIGALCVLDKSAKLIDAGKAELLKIIAREIVTLLTSKKIAEELKARLSDITETQNKLAHDIRGPIAGIIGLARLFKKKVYNTSMDKLQEVLAMIESGGESVVSLAEDILSKQKRVVHDGELAREDQYNLSMFKDAVEKLYIPMAQTKQLRFTVTTGFKNENVFFSKSLLMQITGNLVSNAIKFTPAGGTVTVKLAVEVNEDENILQICVADPGMGIAKQTIIDILHANVTSTNGPNGEIGYGIGLCLVKRLVESLHGTFNISSKVNEGARFDILLPQKTNNPRMTSSEPAFSLAAQ